MRETVRRHPVGSFIVVAFFLSWAWWMPFVLRGDTVRPGDPWPTHMIGLLGPALAAVIVTGTVDGRGGLTDLVQRMMRWRVPFAWYAGCLATIGLGLAVAAMVPNGHSWADASSFGGVPNLGLVLTFLLVLLVNGFGEETGWRGFLADRLLPRHGIVGTALLVALVWGLWHLPLFLLVESFRNLGVMLGGWVVGLVCGSLVLTWMYARSGYSILVVALWHTSYNFSSGTALMEGAPAAVTSAVVMVLAAVIAARTLPRATRHDTHFRIKQVTP